MAEQQTIMERLFHTLDEKAKTLNNENGQSFIENLLLFSIYTILRIEWLRFPRVPSQPWSSTGTAPSGVSPLILRINV